MKGLERDTMREDDRADQRRASLRVSNHARAISQYRADVTLKRQPITKYILPLAFATFAAQL